MSNKTPTDINLHQKSKLLIIKFSDGEEFKLPCEYLRVFSTSAETKVLKSPVVGKENVNINEIEPQGSYAIRILFDDGHDTAIYSWQTLYDLGVNYKKNWNDYLEKIEKSGHQRQTSTDSEQKSLKIIYFVHYVNIFKKQHETITVPNATETVSDLLAFLRKRGKKWKILEDEKVKITVNKHFAELFTKLSDNDEIGIVPSEPQQQIK
ncbi:MAG: DUF971 domain-containing protein [Methylococcales bacterium]|jgi:DUF971 family protein/molybdopterin converting factor small subunit|nr:DUF971 domain-containing protein [Methylococcales bacterium]MBT7408093.1 DUF971 domain-containing protein [Methylococcales bacterium]